MLLKGIIEFTNKKKLVWKRDSTSTYITKYFISKSKYILIHFYYGKNSNLFITLLSDKGTYFKEYKGINNKKYSNYFDYLIKLIKTN